MTALSVHFKFPLRAFMVVCFVALNEYVTRNEKLHYQEGYRLHSVIIHEGEANVGHYWAYIADYSTLDDEGSPTAWRKFNDKSVEPATWSQIEEDSFGSRRACSAYCLVYTRKKCERELFQQGSL